MIFDFIWVFSISFIKILLYFNHSNFDRVHRNSAICLVSLVPIFANYNIFIMIVCTVCFSQKSAINMPWLAVYCREQSTSSVAINNSNIFDFLFDSSLSRASSSCGQHDMGRRRSSVSLPARSRTIILHDRIQCISLQMNNNNHRLQQILDEHAIPVPHLHPTFICSFTLPFRTITTDYLQSSVYCQVIITDFGFDDRLARNEPAPRCAFIQKNKLLYIQHSNQRVFVTDSSKTS